MAHQAPQAANAATEKKTAGPTVEERSIAPLLPDSHHGPPHEAASPDDANPAHKSLLQRLKPNRTEHNKTAHKSISDSGPYEFVFDPKSGKEVLRKNPHWPNEDSYLRENTGLTVKKGMANAPESVKQTTGTWGQTSDSSAQDYFNGYIGGI
ncbi:hypothetical protein LTR48_001264 [Friedmanniomyces endolithicus]|uniref:Uncharacterized protein n=2 Tax=Dothideomycetidae TaxID=451867 RepID=A0A4U0VEK0_9PEZI|nr:hypothetical protein LTS09_000814 [Friedmanniomyces endolithicus]KAK5146719.1 hypothetical protein LTR32_001735 [Rachicladosporium monterosium]KAK0944105.1 hypothetical protein LTR29_004445 [Friedmanniomyces endolithicus]KAK1088743.1 hypothetical protein LTR48_001264 [Friedmanniomyces endolithicus]KAK1825396.1 hypothetical protein LTR12_000197 [Friedmanniomyces endolithicus]